MPFASYEKFIYSHLLQPSSSSSIFSQTFPRETHFKFSFLLSSFFQCTTISTVHFALMLPSVSHHLATIHDYLSANILTVSSWLGVILRKSWFDASPILGYNTVFDHCQSFLGHCSMSTIGNSTTRWSSILSLAILTPSSFHFKLFLKKKKKS